MTTDEQNGPICGRPIPAGMCLHVCPPCAAKALSTDASDCCATLVCEEAPPFAEQRPDAPAIRGEPFGRYVLVERFARGGMGFVYKAWDTWSERFVALKTLGSMSNRDSPLGDLFDLEAKLVAQLEHPHVVRFYDVGRHEGQLYFTMKLMAGSLADCLEGFRSDPEGVARLVRTVAEAVDYVHQRGFLHRDLKPANILLDAEEAPYIADFGIAERLDLAAQVAERTRRIGTVSFMAPELLGPDPALPTKAADVYGIGVILYQLITGGHLPFPGSTPAEVIEKVRHSPPVDPTRTAGVGEVDRELACIALRCLKKNPNQRYSSAEALAKELQRYLDGELREGGRSRRIVRWFLKHPVVPALGVFVTILTWSSVATLRAEDKMRRDEMQHSIEVRAGLGARSVLLHFMELSHMVHAVAEQPELGRAFVESAEARRQVSQASCNAAIERYNDPNASAADREGELFRFWATFDTDGYAIAHTYVRHPFANENYSGRDYFIGAKILGEKGLHQTHLSSVFIGTSTLQFEFALSAPIFAPDGRWVGVVVASVITRAELNSAPLDDQGYTAVLAGPEDPSSGPHFPPILPKPASLNPPRYLVFRHPQLERGTTEPFDDIQSRSLAAKLRLTAEDRTLRWQQPFTAGRGTALATYRDPLGRRHPAYAGPRLAAFAPIGHTGYLFIVQSNESDALGHEKRFLRRLVWGSAVAAAVGFLLATFAAIYEDLRRRRRARRHADCVRARLSQLAPEAIPHEP